MNILFKWIFWIFIKWIMFWTNILVLVCLRQKWLSPNVSNSSEITHGSLVGPISVHFSGLLPILGPQEGSAAITWPHLGILYNFPHFFWMNNSIEYSWLYWMNIFLNEYFEFCFELNFELNHFSARFNKKMNFQNVSYRAISNLIFSLKSNFECIFVRQVHIRSGILSNIIWRMQPFWI